MDDTAADSAGGSSELLYRHLIDAAPDAMVIVDEEGRIVIINRQAEEMFGYPRAQLQGQSIEVLIPAAARSRHSKHRAKYRSAPQVRPMGVDMDLKALHSNGTEIPVEVSLSSVKTDNGLYVSSVIRDVTRRKQLEAALIEARQVAERAHKANTAFLAAASHDLRQPVQALMLMNGALRRTIKEPLAQEIIASQQHSLDAMTNLLNSLLDIGRLDSGTVQPDFEDFPVQRLFDRLSAESARQAMHKALKFEALGDDAIIRSDPNLLAEIIQNLVSNAIRYTDEGRVSLCCVADGEQLRVDVLDTGCGIAGEHLEEIFREFHQLRIAGVENEGFGLGLAIVRRLADLLGHEIRVESVPGEGSRFSVIVPLARNSAPGSAADLDTSKSAHGVGGTILLIEDDRCVASAWSMLLKAEGFDLLLADSVSSAVEVVRRSGMRPDLLISDFHLAENSNGVEAVATIREMSGDDLPAIIISGDTSKVVDSARMLANCVLLSKPVHTDELLERVNGALERGSVE
jgi:PAS domain S-box-containing protein